MAIPLETFVPEYVDGVRVPYLPWADQMTPNDWFRWHWPKFIYPEAKEMISAEAVEYDPEKVPDMPGIYFLVYGDEIGYVGKANDIQRRLKEHRKTGGGY